MENIVGYLGGFFIMISFIPQVMKSWRTKSVGDLSLRMIIATLVGTAFWTWYGFLIASRPVIIMNGIFGLIVLFQLYLKMKHERKED